MTHTSYTRRVLHVCRRYLSLTNWGHLIHPTMAFSTAAAPTGLATGTNQPPRHQWSWYSTYKQLQPTQHVKILFKTNICTTLPHCLAAALLGADNCPQNLGNFGVQTNIKSIPLTFKHRSVHRSKGDPPLHTMFKVNRIDLIFVCTPKFPKFCGQLSAPALRIAK